MGTASLTALVRSGQITECLRLIREHNGRDADTQILLAELIYHAGDPEGAEQLAAQIPLHTANLSPSARARVGMIRSSCSYDAGDYQIALERSREALVLAQSGRDF